MRRINAGNIDVDEPIEKNQLRANNREKQPRKLIKKSDMKRINKRTPPPQSKIPKSQIRIKLTTSQSAQSSPLTHPRIKVSTHHPSPGLLGPSHTSIPAVPAISRPELTYQHAIVAGSATIYLILCVKFNNRNKLPTKPHISDTTLIQ
jgi:hypothetical protein